MEELLASERAAEQQLLNLMKPEAPVTALLDAYNHYRQICLTIILADLDNAKQTESRLWQAHVEGKKYFHSALVKFREAQAQQKPVETRKLMLLYLKFVKTSTKFYRDFIYQLSVNSAGIQELETVAQVSDVLQDKNSSIGESQRLFIPAELASVVLKSVHQSLIYLGDLSRWRASEQLDKLQDFGPAIGYYGLAATVIPASGLGHHQMAVIAQEQRQHLNIIYHLYRSLVVDHPHPNAASNLKSEFKKTSSAWDKGLLIKKGSPNDPDAPKHALKGWFVRLHSVCYKGDVFSGYDELEREVLSQWSNGLRQHLEDDGYDRLIAKMVVVNLAAQHCSGQRFQTDPDVPQHQQSFFYSFRLNIAAFTTLLRLFYDELRDRILSLENSEAGLAVKLTPVLRRVLPLIRLYNMWLLAMVHMVVGLENEAFLVGTISAFWPSYARTIDLVAQGFPIWDLEDIDDVTYMLPEDVDTIAFKPLIDEKTRKTWYHKQTGALKEKFLNQGVSRATYDEEMVQRVKDLLADGLYLANDEDAAPIHLRGTRIFYGDGTQIEELVIRPVDHKVARPVAKPSAHKRRPEPVSYAKIAANGHAHQARRANTTLPAHPQSQTHPQAQPQSRDDQLRSMVADLVDDDDGNNPVTPPQPVPSHPAVFDNTDLQYPAHDNDQDLSQVSKVSQNEAPCTNDWSHHSTPPAARFSPQATTPKDRLQSVANLWNHAPGFSSPYMSGAQNGNLHSPAVGSARGHSRGNSASSVRSKTSQGAGDPWKSAESPFLYGAGGGVWGARPGTGSRNITPPGGQGG